MKRKKRGVMVVVVIVEVCGKGSTFLARRLLTYCNCCRCRCRCFFLFLSSADLPTVSAVVVVVEVRAFAGVQYSGGKR